MKLRDYQIAAVNKTFDYYREKEGNPIIAMPTGTGKSLVIAGLIKRTLFEDSSARILKLTHVKELIQQNADKLKALWPSAPLGICSAGLNKREMFYPITFGGVATLNKQDLKNLGKVNHLIIDECHLLSPKDETMYQKIITELKDRNPDLRVTGLTATPFRAGQGMLTDNGIFTDLSYDLTSKEGFNWVLSQGYLSRLVPKKTSFELDLTGVHSVAGDYNNKELQEAVDRDDITRNALQEAIELGKHRKKWIVFASGIDHAVNVARMLNLMGIPSRVVHSKMTASERDLTLAAYKKGMFRAIVNNGVLTTGFDDPGIDLVIMLRPTKSASLWVQMLGRATRPLYMPGMPLDTAEERLYAIAAGQKPNALVLDYAGNSYRLGPINDPVLPKGKGSRGPSVAPVKVCPVCATYIPAAATVCPECTYEFPRLVKIEHRAAEKELIATDEKPAEIVIVDVDKIAYRQHQKKDKPTSVRAVYYCGLQAYTDFLCFEHTGYAQRRAKTWWYQNAGTEPPETVDEFFDRLDELRKPDRIRVLLRMPYPDVLEVYYDKINIGREPNTDPIRDTA